MNAEQIMLVQSSWEELAPMMEKFGELMYRRVFELDPSLKDKFSGDERQQGTILMSMIGSAVDMLFHIETLEPQLADVGGRHNKYGARPEDYETFRAALLWTLEQLLGSAFVPEIREAWNAVYDHLMESMIKAQREGTPDHP